MGKLLRVTLVLLAALLDWTMVFAFPYSAEAIGRLMPTTKRAFVRLVPDQRRAWHADTSRWRRRMDVNDFSLGWELANRNDGREPYTEAQYGALSLLAGHYILQGLPLDAFVSDAEVALPQGRKSDPAGFLWARFYEGVRRGLFRSGSKSRAGNQHAAPG